MNRKRDPLGSRCTTCSGTSPCCTRFPRRRPGHKRGRTDRRGSARSSRRTAKLAGAWRPAGARALVGGATSPSTDRWTPGSTRPHRPGDASGQGPGQQDTRRRDGLTRPVGRPRFRGLLDHLAARPAGPRHWLTTAAPVDDAIARLASPASRDRRREKRRPRRRNRLAGRPASGALPDPAIWPSLLAAPGRDGGLAPKRSPRWRDVPRRGGLLANRPARSSARRNARVPRPVSFAAASDLLSVAACPEPLHPERTWLTSGLAAAHEAARPAGRRGQAGPRRSGCECLLHARGARA